METLGNIGLDRQRCTLPHEKSDDPGISMVMRVVNVPGGDSLIFPFIREREKKQENIVYSHRREPLPVCHDCSSFP